MSNLGNSFVSEIRILPNDKSTFATEREFRNFFETTMVDRGGLYYFPNQMMQCPNDTLILFQYDGMIRAIGVLVGSGKDKIIDEPGVEYGGYYKFDLDSLVYLETPINAEIMRTAYPKFVRFSQAKQRIPDSYISSILEMLQKTNSINISYNSGSKHKVYFTWEAYTDSLIVNHTGISFFEHNGSSVPSELVWFFDAEDMKATEHRDISLIYDDVSYAAYISKDVRGRARIFWHSDLGEVFKNYIDNISYFPIAQFRKMGNDTYEIVFKEATKTKIIEPLDDTHSEQEKKEHARTMDLTSLRLAAEKHSTKAPKEREVLTKQISRDDYVSEYAKRMANGICQLCGRPAPFTDKNGIPYLEAHHIVWLSRGGDDSVENTTALCPNCHRKMHIVDSKEDVDFLIANNMKVKGPLK